MYIWEVIGIGSKRAVSTVWIKGLAIIAVGGKIGPELWSSISVSRLGEDRCCHERVIALPHYGNVSRRPSCPVLLSKIRTAEVTLTLKGAGRNHTRLIGFPSMISYGSLHSLHLEDSGSK